MVDQGACVISRKVIEAQTIWHWWCEPMRRTMHEALDSHHQCTLRNDTIWNNTLAHRQHIDPYNKSLPINRRLWIIVIVVQERIQVRETTYSWQLRPRIDVVRTVLQTRTEAMQVCQKNCHPMARQCRRDIKWLFRGHWMNSSQGQRIFSWRGRRYNLRLLKDLWRRRCPPTEAYTSYTNSKSIGAKIKVKDSAYKGKASNSGACLQAEAVLSGYIISG